MTAVANPVLWESVSGTDKLRVYGYAPYVSTSANFSTATTNGKTTITYTVPNDVADQMDIIATDVTEVASNYQKNIPLTFQHALTGVRFKVGFDCVVKSLKVVGVYNKANYTVGDAWSGHAKTITTVEYSLPIPSGGKNYENGYVTDEILMMLPQQLPSDAKVVLTYDSGQTITAPLNGLKWEKGALVTYTIQKEDTRKYIYFDLHAGNVSISPKSYEGWVYVAGVKTKVSRIATDSDGFTTQGLHFYIYQSTDANKANYGYADATALNNGIIRLPSYDPVKVGDKYWSDFITNNTNVESVIETWDDSVEVLGSAIEGENLVGTKVVRDVGRGSTPYYISVVGKEPERDTDGNIRTTTYQSGLFECEEIFYDDEITTEGIGVIDCEITIDNIYSRYQRHGATRHSGGLTYRPKVDNSSLTVNLVGDNRFGNLHYFSGRNAELDKHPLLYNNELVLQGSGSLTLACVDFYRHASKQSTDTEVYQSDNVTGYFSNYWCSAIGGDDGAEGNTIGTIIKGGKIFAGTTQAENCTAIGAGGNDRAHVSIEGGSVTAVATSTGTAIGGGIGFNSQGGYGNVKISGGTVFAYNHANEWEIPSAAIGSAGSWAEAGGTGDVVISGGYVYAQTALGTAIGGGSSKTKQGGSANVTISGNSYVIAKSISAIDKWPEANGEVYPAGNGIGGGTGGRGNSNTKDPNDNTKNLPAYGGSAKITISGNPTIRTGSIGGGKTNNPEGKLGSATINISGGDISAQFVMAGGAAEGETTSFTMSGGTISNSDVDDVEFYHVQRNGGAVYMEDGVFTMSGSAKIRNRKADIGGAVYISKSQNALQSPQFKMENGTIEYCQSASDGGAVYLADGSVEMTGGVIKNCLAANGNGGGIYITEGNFKMSGINTTISNNSALHRTMSNMRDSKMTGDGGGIYVSSSTKDVEVTILSGNIQNNTCDQNGGGVCVYMATETNSGGVAPKAIIQIGQDKNNGPAITSNKAVLYGGGMYAKGVNANITIDGGSISNNSVSNYVPNEDVSNEGGTVKLYEGEVSHKIVRFDVNTKTADATAKVEGDAEVKIVTATNSFLVAPAATRSMYNFIEWNTRKDGNGDSYSAGDIINVNLTADLTLYAQWQSQAQ